MQRKCFSQILLAKQPPCDMNWFNGNVTVSLCRTQQPRFSSQATREHESTSQRRRAAENVDLMGRNNQLRSD